MHTFPGSFALLVVASTAAIACSSSSSPTIDAGKADATTSEGGPDSAMHDSSVVGDAAVPGDAGSDVGTKDGAEVDAVPDGPSDAAGVGRLYVVGSNGTVSSIAVYPASASGTPAPIYSITGSFFSNSEPPQWIAVDPAANILYVEQQASVLVFPQGATTPSRTITSSAVTGPIRGLSADTSGNEYLVGGVIVSSVNTYGAAVFGPTASTDAGPLTTFS